MITLTSSYSYGNANLKLYVNGDLNDARTESNMGYQTVGYGTSFVFGGACATLNGDSLVALNMIVENLRFYNRFLSAKEVAQLYQHER